MSGFFHTLRPAVTKAEVAVMVAEGFTLEDARIKITDFFFSQSLTNTVTMTSTNVCIVEDGTIMSDFQAVVIAMYKVSGFGYLKLSNGDVVELNFITI